MDARAIALVCYGNSFFSGKPKAFPIADWLDGDGRFIFRVPQIDQNVDAHWSEVASDADGWFAWLRNDGVIGLKLVPNDDVGGWQQVWKLNGVDTLIEAVRSNGTSDFWTGFATTLERVVAAATPALPQTPSTVLRGYWWQLIEPLVDADASPPVIESLATKLLRHALSVPFLPITIFAIGKSFIVARPVLQPEPSRYIYERVGVAPSVEGFDSVDGVKADLVDVLGDALTFARAHKAGLSADYAARFEAALEPIRNDAFALGGTIRRFSPEGLLDPQADALLEAARRSWVFGGMMSWNDFYVPDSVADRAAVEATYADISRRLYAAVTRAFAAAANSSCPVSK